LGLNDTDAIARGDKSLMRLGQDRPQGGDSGEPSFINRASKKLGKGGTPETSGAAHNRASCGLTAAAGHVEKGNF
jgi:hypothetical protein